MYSRELGQCFVPNVLFWMRKVPALLNAGGALRRRLVLYMTKLSCGFFQLAISVAS